MCTAVTVSQALIDRWYIFRVGTMTLFVLKKNISTKRRGPLFPNDLQPPKIRVSIMGIRVPLRWRWRWRSGIPGPCRPSQHYCGLLERSRWHRTVAVHKRFVSPTIFLRLQSGLFGVCEKNLFCLMILARRSELLVVLSFSVLLRFLVIVRQSTIRIIIIGIILPISTSSLSRLVLPVTKQSSDGWMDRWIAI